METIMPIHWPQKPRAKSIRADADNIRPDVFRRRAARETLAGDTVDWLALWALSIGFSALVLAGLTFFGGDDPTGASIILAGVAAVIAITLGVSKAPSDRG
jgi:hypothetical protein